MRVVRCVCVCHIHGVRVCCACYECSVRAAGTWCVCVRAVPWRGWPVVEAVGGYGLVAASAGGAGSMPGGPWERENCFLLAGGAAGAR